MHKIEGLQVFHTGGNLRSNKYETSVAAIKEKQSLSLLENFIYANETGIPKGWNVG